MFQVSVEETFSAGHALRGYRGKCENVHGHNYRVRVTLEGPQLDATGLLVDFVQLKQAIREVMGRLDHQFMNDLEPFKTVNPSAENVAKYFYDEVTRFEIDLIRRALLQTAGHQVRAARLLNLKVTTLNSKIKHYNIRMEGFANLYPLIESNEMETPQHA